VDAMLRVQPQQSTFPTGSGAVRTGLLTVAFQLALATCEAGVDAAVAASRVVNS
jgi:hypothetical protein